MPKTSGSVDPALIPPGADALFSRTMGSTKWDGNATTWDTEHSKWDAGLTGAERVVLKNTHIEQWKIDPSTQDIIPANPYTANLDRARRYSNDWLYMPIWKKQRWRECARTRNLSGRALYLQCAYQQNTPPEKRPVSPCARRVTDPMASPFDWTP